MHDMTFIRKNKTTVLYVPQTRTSMSSSSSLFLRRMFDSSSLSSRDRSSGTETHDGENTADLNSHLYTAPIVSSKSNPVPTSSYGVHNQRWKIGEKKKFILFIQFSDRLLLHWLFQPVQLQQHISRACVFVLINWRKRERRRVLIIPLESVLPLPSFSTWLGGKFY